MGEIRGLFTAMVTPFRADGSVNDEAGVALARHLLENGSHGLVICGTTGEATHAHRRRARRLRAH